MRSEQRPKTLSIAIDSRRSFVDDDRAIEGLPIRLVIALIVGVVSLGIMMQILGGIDGFQTETEVDVEFQDDTVDLSSNQHTSTFTVSAVDEDGNEVTDATIVATAGEAQMDSAMVESTGQGSNEADFTFANQNLRLAPDQDVGTIEFEVRPPPGSDWSDDEPNNELLVVN